MKTVGLEQQLCIYYNSLHKHPGIKKPLPNTDDGAGTQTTVMMQNSSKYFLDKR